MLNQTVVRLLTWWILLGANAANAGDCLISGSPVRLLESETVEWTLVIGSGQTCIRGLRSGAMLLDSVSLASSAKTGSATVQGYSFTYRAPADYKGEDTFSVRIVGTNRGIRGQSTIHVHINVR